MCLCNMFNQPLHINTGGEIKNIFSAFSRTTTTGVDGEKTSDTTKSTLFSELGMPMGLSKGDLIKLGDISNFKLTKTTARNFFLTTTFDMINEILERPENVSTTAVCYIDPSPTSYTSGASLETCDRSLHAVSFVTRVREKICTFGG